MRVILVGLLIFLVSYVSAKNGSISEDISDEEDKPIEIDDRTDSLRAERRRNPCIRKKCYRGETCVLKDAKAVCICTPDCSFYSRNDRRIEVCSNKNDTYHTECDLDRDHCLCKRKEPGCTRPGGNKIQVEYYGKCQEEKDCPEEEASQFPPRIRNWFFVVMEDLANRAQIGDYGNLLETAKEDDYHSDAVIWKFCDLDKDPQDRHVSKRELQYTVRSLRAMEHCLLPFLDNCDADDDRQITLPEWGNCLGLNHDKITDRCHTIRKEKKSPE